MQTSGFYGWPCKLSDCTRDGIDSRRPAEEYICIDDVRCNPALRACRV